MLRSKNPHPAGRVSGGIFSRNRVARIAVLSGRRRRKRSLKDFQLASELLADMQSRGGPDNSLSGSRSDKRSLQGPGLMND